MASYKPGQVSALLFSGAKKSASKEDGLAKLFSKKPSAAETKSKVSATTPTPTFIASSVKENDPPPENQKKKKKKKKKQPVVREDKQQKSSTTESSATSPPFPFLHETIANKKSQNTVQKTATKRKLEKDSKDDEDVKRPRRNRKRDKTADSRTVFVGNCPLTADKKTLKKLFKEYGEIESVRFRCAPPAEPNLPKRAIVITKNFHEQCNTYIAYIVFKEEAAAKKALARNGHVLDDLHLRVDIASQSKKHDKKRSVFVGNLPFTIKEEEIRSHFSDCGDVTNVRLVRDRTTSLGKGICYVQFESKDSVGLAVKLNQSELAGRQIRVMMCTNKQKKKEEKKTNKTDKSKSPKDTKKKLTFAPSNATSTSFKAVLKAKKEKRFRKIKKKKENAKKSDGLSSIFGDAPAVSKKGKIKKAKGDKKKGNQFKKSSGTKKKFLQKGSAFKGKGKGNRKGGKKV